MAHPLMHENIWFERNRFQEAEAKYQEQVASQHSGLVVQKSEGPTSNLVSEIARARQNIQSSLSAGVGLSVGVGVDNPEILARLSAVEKENADLRKITTDLQAAVAKLTARLSALDTSSKPAASSTPAEAKPVQNGKADDDDDDDFDLFGSDDEEEEEESEEQKKKREEALAGYHAKKAKKPALIAKSNIILDVKPWDDETDLEELEKAVRGLTLDGLVWGASKFVPVAYGIKKLQITCVVEDDKVGTDILEEEITAFEDLVQSVDIAAFNKSCSIAVVAKSSIILDVKPWDDETDLAKLEKAVRGVTLDGLVWGASKFVPLAYGVKKLQITCVVEDDKVGTDILEEEITAFDDLVQSVDIAAFNKV